METPIAVRNNVRDFGAGGRPIVFAHGFGCDQTMWRLVTPAFETTHRIVLFDYVGHGGSDFTAYDRNRYSSLAGFSQDILEICDELALEDVTLVGHSVSSIISILATIQEPQRFRSLVLVSPSPYYLNEPDYHGGFSREDIDGLLEMLDSNYLGWAGTMAPVIMGAPDQPALSKELENSFCRTDPEIAKQFAHVTFLSDHRADLPRTRVRSLIIQVSRDAIAPQEVGRYMHERMPNSSLVTINTSGHCPHLSAPEPTVTAMRQFLEG